MMVTNQFNPGVFSKAADTAKSLQKLYFIRASFSIIWVILVLALAKTNVIVATMLFVIYPAWDAIASYFDIKANSPEINKSPQYINALISIITTVAVAIALQKGIPEALIVFGTWAILTGLIQLILALRRRRLLGGQWPLIVSGAQSMLAGVSFILMAEVPNQGITTLAGYAAFGAFYFLISAFKLTKTIKAGTVLIPGYYKPVTQQNSKEIESKPD